MVLPAAAEAAAPAKVNLALQVTGRRADGYHLLDSLVVFAEVGDRVRAAPAAELTLEIDGPEAAGLQGAADNLVLRAARLLAPGRGARLQLWKALPVASGIGGGSSDAAATLRGLAMLWGLPLPEPAAVLRLGADLPVCLAAAPARMRGIGERLEPVPALPEAFLVLVNPRVQVATPAVFARLARRENPALPAPGPWPDAAALADWLRQTRNDLEPAALELAPAIGGALAALAAQPDCLLARMSGSGATCFGLFARRAAAEAAASAIRAAAPSWWVAASALLAPGAVQATRATT